MGFFSKIKEGLNKTRASISNSVNSILNSFTKIDEELFEELEETLVMADVGVATSSEICDRLRKKIKETGVKDPKEIKGMIKEIIAEMVGENEGLKLDTKPSVILVIGVNGVGKTTSIGKLAAQLKQEGKKVVLGAADTFRAAAIDQLGIWAERAGVSMVKSVEGTDPASVVFDTIASAKSKGADVIICDTAGRLHNKKNLMEELAKINRVISRELPESSVETLLVLDAATGQNAVNQAKLFREVADITGIVLTKLDGTAKGGIIISIHNELGIPVKLVGVGEKIDDLQEFNARDFTEALFATEADFDYNYERLTEGEEETPVEEEIVEEAPAEEIIEEAEEAVSQPEEIIEEAAEEEEITEEITEAEEISEEKTAEEEKPEKKDLKNGKFGFLFKEITFGKKKKDSEGEE